MKTKRSLTFALFAGLMLAVPTVAHAQPKPPEDRRLGITHVEVNASVTESAQKHGRQDSLRRVVESMDAQMVSAFDSIKKFDVVAWSDLKKLVDVAGANQALAGNDGFKYLGCRYSVQVKINDFQDIQNRVDLPALRESHVQRLIRISAAVLIYDTTNGTVFTTANIQVDSPAVAEQLGSSGLPEYTDRLLLDYGRNLADITAFRVADVIFPMKVVARSDKTITLNRGDAFRYQPGMVFDIYSLGEELIDPDTNRRLGQQEERIGAVRVVSVTPESSRCEVLEERQPIARGQIARFPVQSTPQGGQPQPGR